MANLAEMVTSMKKKDGSDDNSDALIGIKIDQHLPHLRDNDPDFDRHWREFRAVMDMYSFGRKSPARKIDQLYLFGGTLQKGGIRHRIYQTAIQAAQHKKRLPEGKYFGLCGREPITI